MDPGGYLFWTLATAVLLIAGVLHLSPGPPGRSGSKDTKLLVCQTSHSRIFPVRHSFSYPLLYVYFRIDEPGANRFWAVDNWRLFHVQSDDYLGSPPCGKTLMEKLKWHLKQHVNSSPAVLIQGISTSPSMRAYMLTMPRFIGYSFNPLTAYYIYDLEHIVTVLEVHNTFGEKHIYVISHSDHPGRSIYISRRFHVSPFNDRLGTYQFRSTSSENRISIELTLVTPENKPKLVATLNSVSESLMDDSATVLRMSLLCGWWILVSMPRILLEAWKLHYRKGLPVYMRPEPVHEKGTIGRQISRPVDLYSLVYHSNDRYFKHIVVEYFRWRKQPITLRILSTNTLIPEVVEINPPGKESAVLSDLFFTNLVCGEPVDGMCQGDVPDVIIEAFVQELHWRKRWEFRYMKAKAMALIWAEKQLFGRIATFNDDTKRR